MDVSSLTKEQLLKGMEKFGMKLAAARKSNMDPEVVKQFQMVLLTYQDELSTRILVNENKNLDPVAWDMDSYLERNRNDRDDEKKVVPKWQSAVIDESSTEGAEPWNSSNKFGFD